jgi:hypothetical protein
LNVWPILTRPQAFPSPGRPLLLLLPPPVEPEPEIGRLTALLPSAWQIPWRQSGRALGQKLSALQKSTLHSARHPKNRAKSEGCTQTVVAEQFAVVLHSSVAA